MILYRKGYDNVLKAEAEFTLPPEFSPYSYDGKWLKLKDCKLWFAEGFCWNGASGPTYDTKSSIQGSLIHDALYTLMVENVIPRTMQHACDKVLESRCVEDGMWAWRAKLWRIALSKFGKSATIRNQDILVAP